jgi:photoactive yellow protein
MSIAASTIHFAQPGLLQYLAALDEAGLDALGFGVIGFGKEPEAIVQRYNAFERQASGLEPSRVEGLELFSVVAQCMNNYLIAQRFDDAVAEGSELDATLPYTLTFRMKPTPVMLRLLSSPTHAVQYVAIQRAL